MKPTLSAWEQAKTYSRFFTKPLAAADPEVMRQLERGPVAPEDATSIQNRNDILNSGDLAVENGYCRMPDGTGFVAVRTVMPDVTAEMLDWWFMWHGLEGLRYKIWCPGEHYDARVKPEDLPRRLDTTLSLQERNWGTTDLVTENVGGGPTNIFISFQSPRQYGYDMSRFAPPNILTAISANAGMSDVWEPNITFSHCARPHAGGGIELRSRFWQGWNVVDGIPVRVGPKEGFPVEVMRDCAYHCAAEYSNLAAILPILYAENHAIVDTAESLAAEK